MNGLIMSLARVPMVLWVFVASVFAYYQYDDIKSGELEQLKQQVVQKQQEVKQVQNSIEKAQEFQNLKNQKIQEREEIQRRFESALSKIPKTAEVPKLLKILSGLAIQVGLELETLKPGAPSAVEFLGLVPVDVKLTGTYAQVLSYMDAVSEETRVIAPQKIRLENPQKRGTASLVTATISFNAYSMDLPTATTGENSQQQQPQGGGK